MARNRFLLVLLGLLVGLSPCASGGPDKTSDEEHLAKQLQGAVDGLIGGKDIDSLTAWIDIEAYLVDGTHFESLPGVLKGESTQCRLVEGKDSKTVFQSLTINDAKDAAFMVVKTQSPGLGERFHSVVFFKGGANDWKIRSWHISK